MPNVFMNEPYLISAILSNPVEGKVNLTCYNTDLGKKITMEANITKDDINQSGKWLY